MAGSITASVSCPNPGSTARCAAVPDRKPVYTMPQHVGIVACSTEGASLCYRTICVEGSEYLAVGNLMFLTGQFCHWSGERRFVGC